MKSAVFRPAAALALWLIGFGLAAPATSPDSERPPLYPVSEKRLSMHIKPWHIGFIVWRFLGDDRIKEIAKYVESMPGDLELKILKLRGEPKATAEEVHEYYGRWAEEHGYQLVVEVQTGDRDYDPMRDDRDRPHRPPWLDEADPEEFAWIDLYHRPAPDGGIFCTVWVSDRIIYIWNAGHIPFGPIVSEWLEVPAAPVDMTPPADFTPTPPNPDLPEVDPERMGIRVVLGPGQLESITADMNARLSSEKGREFRSPSALAAPVMLGAAKRASYLVIRCEEPEVEAVAEPWVRWAQEQGWTRGPDAIVDGKQTRNWILPGSTGGVMQLTYDGEETVLFKPGLKVLILEGAPNLLELLQLQARLAEVLSASDGSTDR